MKRALIIVYLLIAWATFGHAYREAAPTMPYAAGRAVAAAVAAAAWPLYASVILQSGGAK